jgi:hypothetical protein
MDLLESRYKALDDHYQRTAMGSLIDQLKRKIAARRGKYMQQASDVADTELATTVLSAWTQVFWEQDGHLQEVLTREGVLARMARENYSAETVRTKFIIRVAPLNRSIHIGQQTDTYLVTFPTNKGNKLLRELDIAHIIVSFPDEELLALLSLSHYVSMPYQVEEEAVAPQLGPVPTDDPTNSNNGVTHEVDDDANV